MEMQQMGIHRGVIIMDNVRFHHCLEVELIITRNNFSILFLPPYSPFLNPIENTFSKWKNIVKATIFNTEEELIFNINNAVNFFEITDFLGYWRSMIRYLRRAVSYTL